MGHNLSSIVLCCGLCASPGAYASDALTVYGLIDLGLTWFSSTATGDSGEQSMLRVDSSIGQSSRLGFRGSEDLGGGNSVFFTLEAGFAADTGVLAQGLLFGRQAALGVRSARLGTLSVGRQYDFMSNLGIAYAMGVNSAAGSFAWGLHADAANGTLLNDRVFVGERTNNSIKYQTPVVGGYSAGLMVGVGEVAGNSAAGRSVSAFVNRAAGRFATGAAFTTIRSLSGTGSTHIAGVGASYTGARLKTWILGTHVEARARRLRASTYEVGATYGLTPAIDASAGVQYQVREPATGDAKAVIAVLDYKLSTRSDIYLSGVHANDKAYNAFPVFGGGVPAGGGTQVGLRVGLRHRF